MDIPHFIAPMLAQPCPRGEDLDRYGGEWVMEEKFDGQRIIVCVGHGALRTWSRPRPDARVLEKNIPTHLSAVLLKLPAGVYDGEIIVAGGRSWDAGRKDRQADAAVMLFDAIELLGQDLTQTPYDERRILLALAVARIDHEWAVALSAAQPVRQAAVDAIWAAGGEGAMLKLRASPYRPGKRSWSWLKVKQSHTAILEIVGFKPGKTGPHASVVLRDAEGHETSVSARPERMTTPPLAWLGLKLQIEYQCRTPTGSWRHPQWDHVVE